MATASIGVRYNNPGNLTVSNERMGLVYPGQTGIYNSPNGLHYATFGSPEAGSNALVDYLGRNAIGKTLNQFGNYYLNGSKSGGTPPSTINNPFPASWMSAVAAASGLGGNSVISAGDLPNIAAGVAKAEGASSVFHFGTGKSVSSILGDGSVDGMLNNIVNGSVALGGATTSASAAGDAPSGNILDMIAALFDYHTWARVGITAIGVILIGMALFFLMESSPTVQKIQNHAAKLALAAV